MSKSSWLDQDEIVKTIPVLGHLVRKWAEPRTIHTV